MVKVWRSSQQVLAIAVQQPVTSALQRPRWTWRLSKTPNRQRDVSSDVMRLLRLTGSGTKDTKIGEGTYAVVYKGELAKA